MKKLISLALALVIAASLPFAVFAAQLPDIVPSVDGSGTVSYEILSETDSDVTLRVTFSPDEGRALTFFSALGNLGAFDEPLCFKEYTAGEAPEYLDFTVSKTAMADYTAITLVAVYEEFAAPDLMGDIDGDGEISVADALDALRIAAKLNEASERALRLGDVDYDGEITVGDALLILRVAARLEEQRSLERR